jgi:hypothetical protein
MNGMFSNSRGLKDLAKHLHISHYLFMEHDLEKAQNLKLILSAFEQLSGLKINFHKSDLFCFSDAQDEVNAYIELSVVGKANFL